MQGGAFLETPDAVKPEHRPFSPSKGQVRILGPVVQPVANFLHMCCVELLQRCAVRAQLIRDDLLRSTMLKLCFLEEFSTRPSYRALSSPNLPGLRLRDPRPAKSDAALD